MAELTNEQRLHGLADGRFIWQQQLPLKKGDKAFHGTQHSAEHLLYLAMYYAKSSNARASRLEKAVAAQNATINNLVSAVAAVSKGEAFDEAKLLAGVTAAVKNAIESIETVSETTVTIAKGA